MPYKCEKVVKLEGTMLDRRRKLTEDQKAYIKWLHEEEQLSYNALAKQFGVSKRLVIFICNPEIHEKHKARFKELRKDGRYYDREAHNEAVKNMRHYKQELYLEGKY